MQQHGALFAIVTRPGYEGTFRLDEDVTPAEAMRRRSIELQEQARNAARRARICMQAAELLEVQR
jgi:hypothetical protein